MSGSGLQPGDEVGGFVVDGPARRGGMGTVYRAHERATGTPAALKLLDGDGADVERFLREARVLADLRHPAIVRHLADGRTASGGAWLAMEWLDGEDLGERLRRDGLTADESVRLVARIAGGLAVAHERGVVHRDIKPGNVFLPAGEVDQAKLLDFGVARPLATLAGLTQTGVLVGTPAYMAPEQIRSGGVVDARTDVFSLGCVLYECLAGRAAFVGDQVLTVLARILFEDAPVLPVTADLPAALPELLARMLARDPAQRPSDARAVLVELVALGRLVTRSSAAAERPLARAALSSAERRVWSVVLAGPGAGDLDPSSPSSPASPHDEHVPADEAPAACEAVARRFGAQLERLTGGTIAAIIAARGPATDQAADAARFALALRTLLPRAAIALATGSGVVEGASARGPASRPTGGDALERAARMLERRPGRQPSQAERGAAAGRRDEGAGSTPHPRSNAPDAARSQPGDHAELVGAPGGRPGIWIDPVSAALLEGRFEIAGHELLGARDDNQPPQLLGRPAPCYGREHELATLDAVYAEVAAEPTARAVLITAAPGAGKSRLRHEWLHRLAERRDPALILVCRGDPMSAGSPFGLAAQAVRAAVGTTAGEPAEIQRDKLAAHLAARVVPPGRARLALFLGELIGLPGGDAAAARAASRASSAIRSVWPGKTGSPPSARRGRWSWSSRICTGVTRRAWPWSTRRCAICTSSRSSSSRSAAATSTISSRACGTSAR